MNELIKILLPILVALESGGDPNALGDFNRDSVPQAVGILQIHPIMIKDVNRILKLPVFNLKDRYDLNASYYMAAVYFAHYGPQRVAGLPREEQVVILARCWQGGPGGHNRAATEEYGRKARALYRQYVSRETLGDKP